MSRLEKIIVDLDELVTRLREAPASDTHDFAVSLRALADSLESPVEVFASLVEEEALDDELAFYALYGMLTTLWRNRDYAEFREAVDRFEGRFGTQPFYRVWRAEYHKSMGDRREHLQSALVYAEEAQKLLPNVPGVLHLFSELTAELAEQLEEQGPDLHAADTAIRRAIALTNGRYPKYHATHARLLIEQGHFEEARRQIQLALEREPSSAPDYAIRVGDYQLIRMRIQFAEEQERLERQQKDVIGQLTNIRNEMVTLLGLLAAAIAFIVTGVQVTAGKTFPDAARLLVVTAGALIVAFSAFAGLFKAAKPSWAGVTALSGAMLITGGMLLRPG